MLVGFLKACFLIVVVALVFALVFIQRTSDALIVFAIGLMLAAAIALAQREVERTERSVE